MTISTGVLFRLMGRERVGPLVVSEVHAELLSLVDVQCKDVFLAPSCQLDYLNFLLKLVVVYQANNYGVICKLDPVVALYGWTVTCEQTVQPWAEAATLWHSL